MRIKKQDLDNNLFLQTKKKKEIIYLIKTPDVVFCTVGSIRNHLLSKLLKVPLSRAS